MSYCRLCKMERGSLNSIMVCIFCECEKNNREVIGVEKKIIPPEVDIRGKGRGIDIEEK